MHDLLTSLANWIASTRLIRSDQRHRADGSQGPSPPESFRTSTPMNSLQPLAAALFLALSALAMTPALAHPSFAADDLLATKSVSGTHKEIDSNAPHAAMTVAFVASAAKPVQSAGGKIFDKWCSDCHSTAQGPGSQALQRKYRGALPAVLEQRSDLAPDYVRLVVRHGISFMPSFRKTEISDADLALLAAYLARPQ